MNYKMKMDGFWVLRQRQNQTSAPARCISSKYRYLPSIGLCQCKRGEGRQLQICATHRPLFKGNISVADCMPLPSLINTIKTRRWHATISCQLDGRPPQRVRHWKSGRVHLAEDSKVVVLEQEMRSVELGVCPMQLFSFFDHVMKIGWFFTEIWRYIDFQNDGRPPSWNYFTTIRDHSRSPCCWPQLPVKCYVNT